MREKEFNGTVRDEKQYKKLLSLQKAAKDLKKQECRTFECEIKFEEPKNTQPNCVVTVNMLGSFVLLNTPAMRTAVSEMMMLADDVGVVHLRDGSGIRFTFGIRGIWREG